VSLPGVWPQVLDFFGTPLVIEPSAGQLSGNAGLLPLRQFDAALAADDDLAYLATRLRRAWPDVALHFRGDCGFGVPAMYYMCERLRVSYAFGLSANAVLQRATEGLLAEAVAGYEQERQAARQQDPPRPAAPSRLFTGFWYRAGTWPQPRWVVAKAEASDRGTNRRFVVTNRSGAVVLPGPTYDEYAARGESPNRNKEFKGDLAMDRLSDHRFVANSFRLYLHAAARNLLVRLRRFVAEPLPVPASPPDTASPTSPPCEAALPAGAGCLPVGALTGPERQRHFRLRRPRDPLGEGHPCTWRTLLIKVAAEVVVSTRRIVVRLSSSWPHLDWYHRVCARLRAPPSRWPLPNRVADPLGSSLLGLPPVGGKGAVCLRRRSPPNGRARRAGGPWPAALRHGV
jgi:hypothetical protein